MNRIEERVNVESSDSIALEQVGVLMVGHGELQMIVQIIFFSIQSRRWQGQRRHYFTVPFGPYYIWGATARILRGLAERVSGI